jgi:hypothetical protein
MAAASSSRSRPGLKALWPSIDVDPQTGQPNEPNRILFLSDTTGSGERGHGDTVNAGFLRNDPQAGLSAQSNTCVRECQTNADCPSEWICDASAQATSGDEQLRQICVAPSCSAGPESATSERVGDGCLPDAVPDNGFDDAQVYLGTADAECGGGVCLVYGLSGDPREGCVSIAPDPSSGDPGRLCATEVDIEDRIYCSCRCDAPDGYAECGCPDGFSCVDAFEHGGDDIRGGYCVRDGTFTG